MVLLLYSPGTGRKESKTRDPRDSMVDDDVCGYKSAAPVHPVLCRRRRSVASAGDSCLLRRLRLFSRSRAEDSVSGG